MTVSSAAESGGYEAFFGLKEPPFSLTPNQRFLFESSTHMAALEQVTYALRRREPLVVVTGDIGTGKTMLCRTVLDRLERLTFLSIIADPLLGRDDLLKQILEDFGVISKGRTTLVQPSRHELIRALQEFLISLIPLQAHAVVMIDEAQHLHPEVLEEIRLLSNIEADRGTQLQIVLVGQSDLEVSLKRPDMRQFEQRVTRRFRLEPLDPRESRRYIEHRLAVAAGPVRETSLFTGDSSLFTVEAMDAVAQLSGGLPRVINIVCDRALEAASKQRRHTVDLAAVESAAKALGMSPPAKPAWIAPPAQPVPATLATDFDRLFEEAATSAQEHTGSLPPATSSTLPAVVPLPNPAAHDYKTYPTDPTCPTYPTYPTDPTDPTYPTYPTYLADPSPTHLADPIWFATRLWGLCLPRWPPPCGFWACARRARRRQRRTRRGQPLQRPRRALRRRQRRPLRRREPCQLSQRFRAGHLHRRRNQLARRRRRPSRTGHLRSSSPRFARTRARRRWPSKSPASD